mmetsp:Transcript_13014/g.33434  ORF Transcript_13014/g.33434 Transcript_13014/m.33434 type:complete len:244 (+) Transcript_13014:361-1092(+)
MGDRVAAQDALAQLDGRPRQPGSRVDNIAKDSILAADLRVANHAAEANPRGDACGGHNVCFPLHQLDNAVAGSKCRRLLSLATVAWESEYENHRQPLVVHRDLSSRPAKSALHQVNSSTECLLQFDLPLHVGEARAVCLHVGNDKQHRHGSVFLQALQPLFCVMFAAHKAWHEAQNGAQPLPIHGLSAGALRPPQTRHACQRVLSQHVVEVGVGALRAGQGAANTDVHGAGPLAAAAAAAQCG